MQMYMKQNLPVCLKASLLQVAVRNIIFLKKTTNLNFVVCSTQTCTRKLGQIQIMQYHVHYMHGLPANQSLSWLSTYI